MVSAADVIYSHRHPVQPQMVGLSIGRWDWSGSLPLNQIHPECAGGLAWQLQETGIPLDVTIDSEPGSRYRPRLGAGFDFEPQNLGIELGRPLKIRAVYVHILKLGSVPLRELQPDTIRVGDTKHAGALPRPQWVGHRCAHTADALLCEPHIMGVDI